MKKDLTLLLPVFFLLLMQVPLQAQSSIERLSISERADGRGFVIRNHLSALPDSFYVVQPSAERVLYTLYGVSTTDTTGLLSPLESLIPELFQEVALTESDRPFGLELIFTEGGYFSASGYPDVNGRDLLIGLERIAEAELLSVISTQEQRGREVEIPEEQTMAADDVAEVDDPERLVRQDRQRQFSIDATFGIRGGITLANMHGAGYRRDSRNGTTMGMTIDLAFQTSLPYYLLTGFETGISYTEKGFENPVAAKLIVQAVEIDYIEIPFLFRFGYGGLPVVTPYLSLGPYIGFMASAERVREDGTRGDLDDQVRHLDAGWIAAAGVDVKVGGVIASLQVRQSLGQSPLFTDPLLDDGEKNRQIAFVFGLRF